MAQPFIFLYDFFHQRKGLFWASFISVLVLLGFGASQIKLEEDITRFFPDDERVEKLNYVLKHAKFAERLVVMVSIRDSTTAPQPDSLVALATTLAHNIEDQLEPYINSITLQVEDEKIATLVNVVQNHLPVFLDERDYATLDSLTQPNIARNVLHDNYRQLISPSGMLIRNVVINDPLGFSFLVLRKLQQLQYDDAFELYDNFLITKDHRHLVFFVEPKLPPAETGKNTAFIEAMDVLMADASACHPELWPSYFGATAVAVGNARQLQRDTILTITVMVSLLLLLLVGYFKKKRVPFIILVPVFFGALFSLCCVYLVQGSLSILALAVGAVILGVTVDYSLHFLVHLKLMANTRAVIRELVKPLTIGSSTTIVAFFSLQFANAAVLRDIGLFAAFSLAGAALCSLIFLPHLLPETLFKKEEQPIPAFFSSIITNKKVSRYVVFFILAATPFFFYFAGSVSFNSDMSKLNFMNAEVTLAQQRLEQLNKASLTAVYVIAEGKSLEAALQKNEQVLPILNELKNRKALDKYSDLSLFLPSDSLQRVRIARWNTFWTSQRKDEVSKAVNDEGKKLKFSPVVLANFDSLISKNFEPTSLEVKQEMRKAFFDEFIIEQDGLATVISLARVSPAQKPVVYEALAGMAVSVFDRQLMTNKLVELVNEDFTFIVTFTSVLVFMALWLVYGRIELTFITFVPMLLTWIWILGLMALFQIEFNIVNVMVSTFIFGLGDDYSIFIMDGLQQEYQAGKKNLPAIRVSIVLSAVTTMAGLGVLAFAEHPALRSIAAISIIGIGCVFIMAQTIEPFLFRWLITNRTLQGKAPITFFGLVSTTFTYGFFVLGSIVLTVIGLVVRNIPFKRTHMRLFFHTLLSGFTRALIRLAPGVKVNVIGKTVDTFSQPSVILANHSSFIDILVTTMLHPKIILLTNKWVWNSPIFGGVVRLADYYPVTEGATESTIQLKDRVEEGYSVLVFPEGTRSKDGNLQRFHKGAFYLAERLSIPIQPLVVHGAAAIIPKGDFYVNKGRVTLTFLTPIATSDNHFGVGYSERTKKVSRYFKQTYANIKHEQEIPDYFASKLIASFIYKGPVLEWYLRVKLAMEKNYTVFHKLIPRQANVLDLGCGYGFLAYMLCFLSEDRTITGVDYDEEKIVTAKHGFCRTIKLNFYCADVTKFQIANYDVIVISDVLHYLKPADQEQLITRCVQALPPGGRLIIRDGNADMKKRHVGTALTEFFSVKVLRFNKAVNTLSFVSGEAIRALATKQGMQITEVDDTKFTSNVIFVLDKPILNG